MTTNEAIQRLEEDIEKEEILLDLAKQDHDFALETNDELAMRDLEVEIAVREHVLSGLNMKLSQLLKKV